VSTSIQLETGKLPLREYEAWLEVAGTPKPAACRHRDGEGAEAHTLNCELAS
jgi:hypothetical protein